jgi:hypothetical protein
MAKQFKLYIKIFRKCRVWKEFKKIRIPLTMMANK